MPEVVKSTATIVLALAVFVVLLIIVFEIFYGVKIGSLICNFIGKLVLTAFGYAGVFLGLTNMGIEAACNAFPI